jgi:hypothetical protein
MAIGVAFSDTSIAEPSLPIAQYQMFNIPTQPLATALEQFGKSSKMQVLYESRIASRLQSPGAHGGMTAYSALEKILSGTGLTASFVGPNAITVGKPSPYPDDEPPVSPLSEQGISLPTLQVAAPASGANQLLLRAYNDAVTREIRLALEKDPDTSDGNYTVGVEIWLTSTNRIGPLSVVQSSGSGLRDLAISRALQGVSFSVPLPDNVPQPVRVTITVRSL